MSKLAVFGGSVVRSRPFPAHRTIGIEEESAALRVLNSGVLSKFLGAWHDNFLGGDEVQKLEADFCRRFNVRNAIAVNSNTSGLICAVGALEILPGDEVLVCGYSMSISATAPLVYGAVPVFVDLEPDFFCMSVVDAEMKITSRTKAIIIVDLFGQPYDFSGFYELAKKYDLKIIEDCAQAPGAKFAGRYAGALGDVGVFSLNYHKHIHSGEGGVIVTDDDDLADRMRLIRNHAEAVISGRCDLEMADMFGFNFRMTEIEAAIASEQLKKLDNLVEKRVRNVRYLEENLTFLTALKFPAVRESASHVYYQHACLWDSGNTAISRDVFVNALKAELPHFELREKEGVRVNCGYVRPIYKLPIFQNKNKASNFTHQLPDYTNVSCPVTEMLHFTALIHHEFMLPSMELADLDDVILAFEKVWSLRHELEGHSV